MIKRNFYGIKVKPDLLYDPEFLLEQAGIQIFYPFGFSKSNGPHLVNLSELNRSHCAT